jgi:hypothetical protein
MVNGTEANICRLPNTVMLTRTALTTFLKGNWGVSAKCFFVYTEVYARACRPGCVNTSSDPSTVSVSADTYGV